MFAPGPSAPGLFTFVVDIPPGLNPTVIGGGATFQLNLFAGGALADAFTAIDGGELNVFGGSVGDDLDSHAGSEINILGGTVGARFTARGNRVDISGGEVGNVFSAGAGREINISGGNFSGGSISNVGLAAYAGSEVNISGGIIREGLQARFGSVMNISAVRSAISCVPLVTPK